MMVWVYQALQDIDINDIYDNEKDYAGLRNPSRGH